MRKLLAGGRQLSILYSNAQGVKAKRREDANCSSRAKVPKNCPTREESWAA